MQISNFLNSTNSNYILCLKKDREGVHLQEVKKGFLTWIAVKVLKKKDYQLPTIVEYVNKQGNQILNEGGLHEPLNKLLINKLNEKINHYNLKRKENILLPCCELTNFHPIKTQAIEKMQGIDSVDQYLDSLHHIQLEVEKRGLPLSLYAKKPEESYAPKEEEVKKYKEAVKVVYSRNLKARDIALKAIGNVQHISFERLEKALKLCIQNLNQELDKQKCPFSVGLTTGKSQQWVASLSLRYLTNLPTNWFSLGRLDSCYAKNKSKFADLNVEKIKEKTLVIFDDCSYSGRQLAGTLYSIGERLKEHKMKKTLIVVIPFMTKRSIELLETQQKYYEKHLNIKLITSEERIKSIDEIFPKEELPMAMNIVGASNPTVTFCYTDWRTPDNASIASGLGKIKVISYEEGEEIERTVSCIPSNIPRPYAILE